MKVLRIILGIIAAFSFFMILGTVGRSDYEDYCHAHGIEVEQTPTCEIFTNLTVWTVLWVGSTYFAMREVK